MKLESQVVTLEQAKRLNELGVVQESYFSWFYTIDRDDIPALNKASRHDCAMCGHPIIPYFAEVSAWTVAELGVMLNSECYTGRTGSERSEYANWEWIYESAAKAYGPYNTEAEARADLLIHLLETKVITAEDINKRLQQ